MNKISPCKDCQERHTACHGHCEKYQQWAKDCRDEKRALEAEKAKLYDRWSPAKRRAIWLSLRRDNSGAYKKFPS